MRGAPCTAAAGETGGDVDQSWLPSPSGTGGTRALLTRLAAAALLAWGCGGDHAAATGSFRLTLAQGGGFTGLYTGYHLHADGRIERWQQLPGGIESVTWQAVADEAEVRQAAAQLRSAAGDWRGDGGGNVTCTATLVQGDSTSHWSWPGPEPPAGAPPAFRDWLRRTRALCERAAANAQAP